MAPFSHVITAESLENTSLPRGHRSELVARATAVVTVEFLGTTVGVYFDDEEASARYARRYHRFRSESVVEKRAFAVRDGANTFFWYEDRPAYRWPDSRLDSIALDFLADSVVRREFFSETADYLTFHAAAVEVERGAVAIVAPSTGGKTTTAIACARRGMRLYTDEECVTKDGRVCPFPRAINLRADGIARILADPEFSDGGIRDRLVGRDGQPWQYASFDELFGATSLPDERDLIAMYFLRPGEGRVTIVPMTLGEALPVFFTAWPRSNRPGVDRVADAVRIFSAAPPYALTLGTPDETARALRDAGRR